MKEDNIFFNLQVSNANKKSLSKLNSKCKNQRTRHECEENRVESEGRGEEVMNSQQWVREK